MRPALRDESSRHSKLANERRCIDYGGGLRAENLDHILSLLQTPQTLEISLHPDQAVRVAVPVSEDGRVVMLEVLHVAGHAAFQSVRLATVVEEKHQDVMTATEHDLVVLELDAPDVSAAHRVKRLVHERDDRGEHRGNDVRIRAGRQAAGEMHHRDATPIDEEDVLHDGAKRMEPGHEPR